MVPHGFHKLPFYELMVATLIMLMIHQTHGSRLSTSIKRATSNGICASAIIIHGYKCEEIHVTTKDGFVLNLQRMFDDRNSNGKTPKSNRQPVLLHHGLLVDGMSWFLNLREQNLPMILADKGFEVWIANVRGSRFSSSHKFLNPNQREYWDWSWDELVEFDLPAITDHVRKVSGQKMHYVGHSMGTMIALASFSRGLLGDKLKSAALLTPVAHFDHMTSPLASLFVRFFLAEMSDIVGFGEFNPAGEKVGELINIFCSKSGINCYDILSLLTGKNCCLNSTTVSRLLKYEPQPTSTKNLMHFGQTIRSGILRKYDYGEVDNNMKHYGKSGPPVYNLSNIGHHIPLFLSYGGKDLLAHPKDVQYLITHDLKFHDKNKLTSQLVNEYAHLDFMLAVNAKDLVYDHVISFFNRFPS